MNYTIKLYPTFKKQFKHLFKRYKSLSEEESEIGLLYIYDKSERETITDTELTDLLHRNGIL
ncbi:MAG TPA: hypothetical protein H9814_10480 [Candidatus Bacteroides merdigallinarum]|uniref:Uncharacterized protein n=1 Tax=Candidatus Bacteroides merdigallinarum TaxID=2838473 RepID=A0A9D2EAT4_9BACE|nr:hypothetical protein [Candidatus Bacteroides merdigallinarum]